MGTRRTAAAVLAIVGLGAAAACGDDGGSDAGGGGGDDAVTVTYWVNWSETEKLEVVLERFEEANPDIDVEVVGGVDAARLAAAIGAGNPPDLASTFEAASIGQFCGSGAWTDLTPHLDEAGIGLDVFPEAVQRGIQWDDKICALPTIGDAFGLYYNVEMLEAAGFSEPPRTLSELTEMAQALTQRNADGSIAVAGFVPLFEQYQSYVQRWAMTIGADYFDESGTASLSTDPRWAELLEWQRDLIDFYGHEELLRFVAGAGEEFSPANPFQSGKVAMTLDGEWRTQFLANEAPDLEYRTAPLPVLDSEPGRYGAAELSLGLLVIPRGAEHDDAAFELARFIATDPQAQEEFAEAMHNIPALRAALESPTLEFEPEFQTFLDAYGNPLSGLEPATAVGRVHVDAISAFVQAWQAGEVADLAEGLRQLDEDIDGLIENAGGGS